MNTVEGMRDSATLSTLFKSKRKEGRDSRRKDILACLDSAIENDPEMRAPEGEPVIPVFPSMKKKESAENLNKVGQQETHAPSKITVYTAEDKSSSTNEFFSSLEIAGEKTESGIRAVWVWNDGTTDDDNEDFFEQLGAVEPQRSGSPPPSNNSEEIHLSRKISQVQEPKSNRMSPTKHAIRSAMAA